MNPVLIGICAYWIFSGIGLGLAVVAVSAGAWLFAGTMLTAAFGNALIAWALWSEWGQE